MCVCVYCDDDIVEPSAHLLPTVGVIIAAVVALLLFSRCRHQKDATQKGITLQLFKLLYCLLTWHACVCVHTHSYIFIYAA